MNDKKISALVLFMVLVAIVAEAFTYLEAHGIRALTQVVAGGTDK